LFSSSIDAKESEYGAFFERKVANMPPHVDHDREREEKGVLCSSSQFALLIKGAMAAPFQKGVLCPPPRVACLLGTSGLRKMMQIGATEV